MEVKFLWQLKSRVWHEKKKIKLIGQGIKPQLGVLLAILHQ